jgi:alkylhydroperoxidase family enzyme
MSPTVRIPEARVTGLYGYAARRVSRKLLGEVPASLGVMWNNRVVLKNMMAVGRKADKWDQLDPDLKSFAHMAAVALVGCSFCLDLAYFQTHNRGLDETKASEVPRWRESTAFTPLERDVMAYAEAMTATPPEVTDELFARLLEQLGPSALIELSAWVGFANAAARCNTALGIEAQGFSKVCARPLAPSSGRGAMSA